MKKKKKKKLNEPGRENVGIISDLLAIYNAWNYALQSLSCSFRERKLDSSGFPTGLAIIISAFAIYPIVASAPWKREDRQTDVRKIPDGEKHGQTDHMRTDHLTDRE